MIKFLRLYAKEDNDTKDLAFRKLLILIIASSCSVCGIIWSLLYIKIFGVGLIAALPFLFTLVVGLSIFISHYLKQYKILVYAQIICIMWVCALIQWTIGSLEQSGFVIAWAFLAPLGAVIFLSIRQAVVWMLMFLFILVVSAVYEPAILGKIFYVPKGFRTLLYIMNVGTASTVVFISSAWFMKIIQTEKMRTEDYNKELTITLENLKATQERLIQSEKMAAFGAVATRMSHEIQNPLNFINNFSEMSKDLVSEIINEKDEREKIKAVELLSANLEKILYHGTHAEAIVRQLQKQTNEGTAHEFFEE